MGILYLIALAPLVLAAAAAAAGWFITGAALGFRRD